MDEHGDFDKCFYNDHCSKPLGPFISFNNVASNIGYIILGITFTIIISINRFMKKNSLQSSNYGIFYALGFSLIMEGVMSASYHICPSRDNIQFDVTFMYIIGFLLNLYYAIKLLQKYHNNVKVDKISKDFYLLMSIAMLIIIVLSIFEDEIGDGKCFLLPGFQIVVISLSLIIFKPPTVDKCDFKLFNFLKSTLLVIFTNICVVLIGLIWIKKFYFYFLVVILANVGILLLECYLNLENRIPDWKYEKCCCGLNIIFGVLREIVFFFWNIGREIIYFIGNIKYHIIGWIKYMVTKIWNNKFISINIFASGILWIFAIILYSKAPTNWNSSPSVSREYNQECVLWGYFDVHDEWHILSSIAMFLSFMWIFMIDEKIKGNNGDETLTPLVDNSSVT